jgi:hypothetical protein
VRIGDLGGLGAARVDHHQAATALPQRLGLAAEVGHGPQAAVAGHRVGADHQQVVAASMSGTATLSQWPNISPLESCLGIWSSVEAENTFFVPSALASREKYSSSPYLCAEGLPTVMATASRP